MCELSRQSHHCCEHLYSRKSQAPCGGTGKECGLFEGYEILKCLLPLAKLISELTETSEEQSLLNNWGTPGVS